MLRSSAESPSSSHLRRGGELRSRGAPCVPAAARCSPASLELMLAVQSGSPRPDWVSDWKSGHRTFDVPSLVAQKGRTAWIGWVCSSSFYTHHNIMLIPDPSVDWLESSYSRATMAALDVLAVIAFVMGLTGLDAIILIKFAARLLRIPQCKAECDKLKKCTLNLRAMLQLPEPNLREVCLPTGDGTLVKAVLNTAMAPKWLLRAVDVAVAKQLMIKAEETLAEADHIMSSYCQSTFWCLVQTSRSMEVQICAMQEEVNSLCAIAARHNLYTFTVHRISTVICVPSNGTETSGSDSYNGTGQAGVGNESDNTEPGRSESAL